MAENKRHDKGVETRKQQAAAKIKVHPRGLARSVAKYLGADNGTWRQQVAALPRTGRSRIYPKIQRQVRKVEEV